MLCSVDGHGRTQQSNMRQLALDLLPFSHDHRGTRENCVVFETRNRRLESAFVDYFRLFGELAMFDPAYDLRAQRAHADEGVDRFSLL